VWCWQDLRYAVRSLRKAPGFSAITIAVLAIGIGANTAIFALVDAALIRPLPFNRSDELVMLWERTPSGTHNRVSPLNFVDWSEQQHSFSAMTAIAGGPRTLTGMGSTAERVPGQSVTARFFDVFDIKPIAGQTFDPVAVSTDWHVVVISEGFWRNRLGADPTAIGRRIMLDGEAYAILGVVPSEFQILYAADLWTPFVPRRTAEQRRQHYLQVIGRIKTGMTIDQARADMLPIATEISRLWPDTNKDWGIAMEPLHDAIVARDLRTTSLVLAGVVAFVLLMACANVANLLLARGLGRSREIAVRAALGGSRARIAAQLLAESFVLAAAGGAAGLALAWTCVRVAPAFVPRGTIPTSIVLVFDWRIAVVAIGLTVLTTLLFGLAPAWHASSASLSESTGAGARTTRGGATLRAALVVGQIAAAVLLVSGAGLLVRTLVGLTTDDPGFRAEHVLTASIRLPFTGYASVERMRTFYRAAERELSMIPGVSVAAFGQGLPLEGFNIGQPFHIVGDPPVQQSRMTTAQYQMVSSGYFRALGIDIVRGRMFDERDSETSAPVCIVDEEFVRRHANGRDPIGLHVTVPTMEIQGPSKDVDREIVGVVRQVAVNVGERNRLLEIYIPQSQNAWFSASLVVRTAADPMSVLPGVRAAIARVDKDLPISGVRTMDDVAAEATSQPRFRAELVGIFALLALAVAAIGIFAVLAFIVRQRAREFGIRRALGARSSDVLGLVLRQAASMTVAGIAIGLIASALLTRFLAALLFGVRPIDPMTFGATAAILASAALVACATPAWRATRVDPAIALRQE